MPLRGAKLVVALLLSAAALTVVVYIAAHADAPKVDPDDNTWILFWLLMYFMWWGTDDSGKRQR